MTVLQSPRTLQLEICGVDYVPMALSAPDTPLFQ